MKSNNKSSVEELKETALSNRRKYSKLFSTAAGKEVLADLEDKFMNRTSIVPNDPYATHAREGAREVILFIHENMQLGAKNET